MAFPQDVVTLAMLDKLHGDTLDVIFGLCPQNGIHLTPVERNGVIARAHDVGHFSYRQKDKPKPPGFDVVGHRELTKKWRKQNCENRTARALSILDRHGPLTLRGFARRMWPGSPTWQLKVARKGQFGPVSGPGHMNTVAGSLLGKLRKKGFVKMSQDKYAVSARGRKRKGRQ